MLLPTLYIVMTTIIAGGQSEKATSWSDNLVRNIQNLVKPVVENILPVSSYAPADAINDKINETINELADLLKDPISFDHMSIAPGQLEFGDINLQLDDGQISGLGDMVGEIVQFTIIPLALKNITIHFSRVQVESKKYTMAGYMLFPLGNQIIELTGTGAMSIAIVDLYVSVNATVGYEAAATRKVAIKKLNMYAWAGDVEMSFENLMNDDELSWAFNQVLNDVGITAFNYYKDGMLQQLNEPLRQLLTWFIQQLLP